MSVREGTSPTSAVKQVSALDEGFAAAEFLISRFGPQADGVYNIDFMVNPAGSLVLNEVNPGRFPAGSYPLKDAFAEMIVDAFATFR